MLLELVMDVCSISESINLFGLRCLGDTGDITQGNTLDEDHIYNAFVMLYDYTQKHTQCFLMHHINSH